MHYPVYLNLKGKTCLVVGGGAVAQRKVASLLRAGARIRVVSPVLTEKLERWARSRKIQVRRKLFSASDLGTPFLVIGATSSRTLNQKLSRMCFRRRILVNIVDQPKLCNFIVPSHFKKGPLHISVSSGGASPLAVKLIRRKIERNLRGGIGSLVEFLGRKRKQLLRQIPNQAKRRAVLKQLIRPGFARLFARPCDRPLAEKRYQKILRAHTS